MGDLFLIAGGSLVAGLVIGRWIGIRLTQKKQKEKEQKEEGLKSLYAKADELLERVYCEDLESQELFEVCCNLKRVIKDVAKLDGVYVSSLYWTPWSEGTLMKQGFSVAKVMEPKENALKRGEDPRYNISLSLP